MHWQKCRLWYAFVIGSNSWHVCGLEMHGVGQAILLQRVDDDRYGDLGLSTDELQRTDMARHL